MSRTAIAVEQTIWDCRWSQPGVRVTGAAPCPSTGAQGVPSIVEGREQPEPAWVCIRTGERRPVSESECGQCPHWQRDESRWN